MNDAMTRPRVATPLGTWGAMTDARASELGALELAYIGDTVYDLYVRAGLLTQGGGRVNGLHLRASKRVCAAAQARAFARIEPELDAQEAEVARRGRNAAHRTMPKNGSAEDYHAATALEALIGYLYITGRTDRMDEIMRRILSGEE